MTRRRRRPKLGAPLPLCPYGCGVRVETATGDHGPVLVTWQRADPSDTTATLAVRRLAGGAWVARSLRSPQARPLEPNERRHHDHDLTCTTRTAHHARQGSAAADGVVDVTRPRRTET